MIRYKSKKLVINTLFKHFKKFGIYNEFIQCINHKTTDLDTLFTDLSYYTYRFYVYTKSYGITMTSEMYYFPVYMYLMTMNNNFLYNRINDKELWNDKILVNWFIDCIHSDYEKYE